MTHKMKRSHYADMFGPTTGDRIRLGDTSLILQIEKDHTVYGDECKFGGGKVLRDGMGQASGVSEDDALDCVITNALAGLTKNVAACSTALHFRRYPNPSRLPPALASSRTTNLPQSGQLATRWTARFLI